MRFYQFCVRNCSAVSLLFIFTWSVKSSKKLKCLKNISGNSQHQCVIVEIIYSMQPKLFSCTKCINKNIGIYFLNIAVQYKIMHIELELCDCGYQISIFCVYSSTMHTKWELCYSRIRKLQWQTTPLMQYISAQKYRPNRNGNAVKSFSYVCKNKKINELFAPTLIGITATVRCVSSTTVVLNVTLRHQLWHKRAKKDYEKRRNLKLVTFFCVVEQ